MTKTIRVCDKCGKETTPLFTNKIIVKNEDLCFEPDSNKYTTKYFGKKVELCTDCQNKMLAVLFDGKESV